MRATPSPNHQIPIAMTPNSSGRQRVFISYGRKDALEAVQWLRDRLRAEGFDPWMDTAELVGGDAWQTAILNAIESSDSFVALISDHSVREGSCCYAEIEAALMSSRALRIVPVVLRQDEATRGKPLRLLPLHQVNLSGFDMLSEAEREAGFQHVLAALRGELPTDTALHAAKSRFGRLDFDWLFAGYRRFEGRRWLFNQLDEWLTAGAERALLLSAPPGTGKTACMVRWVSERLSIGAYHFCRHDALDTRDPRKFVASVVHQMLNIPASDLPQYRELVLRRIKEFSAAQLLMDDPASTLQDLVLQPLRQLESGRRWVLVIDALDEATEEFRQMLAAAVPTLPDSVRIVMTTRAGSGIESMFEPHLVRRLHLDPEDARNREDLQHAIRTRLLTSGAVASLNTSQVDALVEAVAKNSSGIFANAEFHLEELDAGRLSLQALATATGGNEAMYLRAMSRVLPAHDEALLDRCLQSISVLIASPVAMPDTKIAEILDRPTRSVRADFDRLAACFPVGHDGSRRVFHASYTDWLVDPKQRHPYQVDRREGLQALQRWAERTDTTAAWSLLARAQLGAADPQGSNAASTSLARAMQRAERSGDLGWEGWLALIHDATMAFEQSRRSEHTRAALVELIARALEHPEVPESDALSLVDVLAHTDRLVRSATYELALECPIYVKHWMTKADPIQDGRFDRLRRWVGDELQFELIARNQFPGIDIRGHLRSPHAAAADTWRAVETLRLGEGGLIHHATFRHEQLTTVVDLLWVTKDGCRLGRVLPRMISGTPDEFQTRDGRIRAEWRRHFERAGFELEVVRRSWIEHFGSTPVLHSSMIGINGSERASTHDHSANIEHMISGTESSPSVSFSPRWKVRPPAEFRSAYVARHDVTGLVSQHCKENWFDDPLIGATVGQRIDAVARLASGLDRPDPATVLGVRCRNCLFASERKPGTGCGRDECWGMTLATVPDHVLHLPRLTPRQFDAAVRAAGTGARMASVPVDLLYQTQRLAAQAQPRVTPAFAASSLLGLLEDEHRTGPAGFLSVAMRGGAVPTQKNEFPWMLTPYTFEALRLPTLGAPLEARVRLDGFYWLDGVEPSRAFVDAMILQFGLEGPIFHWHHSARTVLNSIKKRLLAAPEAGDDKRVAFIESLAGADGKGGGRLIDLMVIARQSFSHPDLKSDWAVGNVSTIAWSVPEIRSTFTVGHSAQGDPAVWQGVVGSGPLLRPLPQQLMSSLGLRRGIVASSISSEESRASTEDEIEGPSRGMPLAEVLHRYIRLSGREADSELLEYARQGLRLRSAQLLMVFGLMRDHIKHWPVEERQAEG